MPVAIPRSPGRCGCGGCGRTASRARPAGAGPGRRADRPPAGGGNPVGLAGVARSAVGVGVGLQRASAGGGAGALVAVAGGAGRGRGPTPADRGHRRGHPPPRRGEPSLAVRPDGYRLLSRLGAADRVVRAGGDPLRRRGGHLPRPARSFTWLILTPRHCRHAVRAKVLDPRWEVWETYLPMDHDAWLRVEKHGPGWRLVGRSAEEFGLVNDYLGHLVDRRYSPATVRAYAFDLLHLARWLAGEGVDLEQVTIDELLRFLTACRTAELPGRPGANVYSIRDGRNTGYAPTTVNRRLAAVSGLFAFRQQHEPGDGPVPVGAQAAQQRAHLGAVEPAGQPPLLPHPQPRPVSYTHLTLP